MTNRQINCEKKDSVCIVTMNHSLTTGINLNLIQELDKACGEITADPGIKVVIITGTGNIFSDDSVPESKIAEEADILFPISIPSILSQLTCPVIAAINGDAIGTGLELALACDIRIAVESARFGLSQIKSGRMPHHGGTQLLPRIVGKAKAIEMILTGEFIGAREALDTGLVTRIVAADELFTAVSALSTAITAQSPTSLKHAKEAVIKGLDLTLEQGLRLEGDLYFLLHTTEDRTEGIRAFLEKRQPHFKGK